jgi:hypothetical protein
MLWHIIISKTHYIISCHDWVLQNIDSPMVLPNIDSRMIDQEGDGI